MNSLTVNQIIKAQKICFLRQNNDDCSYCKECPLIELNKTEHCQKFLAESTIEKLNELVQLLDDKVNHHYYDTLESLQEENSDLRSRMEQIQELIQHS